MLPSKMAAKMAKMAAKAEVYITWHSGMLQ